MNLPKFLDISQHLLQENAYSIQFDGDTAFSFPVLAWKGKKLVDAMFLYRASEGVPYAWTLLDSETGRMLLMAERIASDFAPKQAAAGNAVELSLSNPLDSSAYASYYHELYEAYEQVRTFAFQQELSEQQQTAMERYRTIFLQIVYTEHLPFYEALSPEFFRWMGLSFAISAQSQIEISKRQSTVTPPEEQRNVLRAIAELSDMLQEKLTRDKKRDVMFDAMYEELQQYRNGMLETASEPLERDIIKVIEDVTRSLDAHRGKIPTRENYNRFFALFEGIQTDLKDLLFRHGVESYSVPGSKVDIDRQQILATTPTSSPELDKTVAQRHSKGWERAGKVIRPERITAYVYTDSEGNIENREIT